MQDSEHGERTKRNGYRYLFTAKHHGGDKNAARWLSSVSRDTEFSIFEAADQHEITDDRGWLYGVLCTDGGELRDIGVWDEQVAEFQPGQNDQPWHGYPKWALNELAPANRRRQKSRPVKGVLDKMLTAGLISWSQRQRFMKGEHT